MTTDLQTTFYFPSARVRVQQVDGVPWLCGEDVCSLLWYEFPKPAIRQYVNEQDVKHLSVERGRRTPFITVGGLYGLCLMSDNPDAMRVFDWVSETVLQDLKRLTPPTNNVVNMF